MGTHPCQQQLPPQPQFNSIQINQLHHSIKIHIHDQPPQSYALLVQSRPDFSNQTKITLTNHYRTERVAQGYPIYYIKQKNAYYQGQWKNGLPHGNANVLLDKGFYFEGSFSNGEANCDNALIIYPDGTTYEGEVANSTLNGYGILSYPNNVLTYLGQWRNGQPHGDGEQRYSDGTIYKGSFVNGVKEGKGIYIWGDYEYHGEFTAGQMTGKGLLKNHKNHTEYDGEVVRGKKHGLGKLKNKYGVLQGQFFEDFLDSEGIFRWKDGKIYVGQFRKNQFHGKGRIILPNKQITDGVWQEGKNILITNIENNWQYRIEPIMHSRIRSTIKNKQII